MSIHIKPENKGKFTAYKKRTGKTTEEALHSPDPHVRQMANFARNAKKWKRADGGTVSGGCTDEHGNPIPCPDGVKDGTMVVASPTNPRLKAYQDSLTLHNNLSGSINKLKALEKTSGNIFQDWGKALTDFQNSKKGKDAALAASNLSNLNNKYPQPSSTYTNKENLVAREYKKPVQPVVYQKLQQNDEKLDLKTADKMVSDKDKYRRITGKELIQWKINNPNKKNITDVYVPVSQEQKDYPIVTHPKAQAKIQITAPQPYTPPIPQGDYVYGPANSVIGINTKEGFVPWSDDFDPTSNKSQRGKVNQADIDLLQNPTELKKYLKSKGLKNGGKVKGAWGAALGTDQYIGGPDPINPYPKGFKFPELDAQGNPIPAGQIPDTWSTYPTVPGQAPQPVPVNPNKPQMLEMDPKQTGVAAPNTGEGQLNRGEVPNLTEGQKKWDQTAIAPASQPMKSPEGAGGGGFTGQGILAGLQIYSAFMGPDRKKRRYVRPEDMESYNPNQYGTGSQALSEYGNTLKGKKKAVWGAIIGAVAGGKGGIKPVEGLHNNINEGMAPLLNVANQGTERAQYLDNTDFQNTANLQSPQQILPAQQKWTYMEDGGKMRYTHGGELQTGEGGNTQLKSYNPFDGGTMQFNGDSHEEGGIDIDFQGEQAEVEGGETAFKDRKGDLKIMGNLKVPGTNMKYKTFSKQLAEKEKKAQKLVDKGVVLLNTANPDDAFERLSFNAGKAMTTGGLMRQKELADAKEHLGNMQEAHLEVAKEKKMSPDKLFKNGGRMYGNGGPDPKKPWVYKGANVKNLDPKIKEFMALLEAKGISGYSGEGSGYRNSKTTSGRKSRHAKNEALDIIPVNGEATYQEILKDLELVNFLITNGLTAINEYDKDVAKKTGATAGHIHIGRDKGTKVADQFRADAAALYPDKYSTEPMYKMNDSRGELYTAKQLADIYDMSPKDIQAQVTKGKLSYLGGGSSNYKEPALNKGAGDAQTENYKGFVNKPFDVPEFDYTPKPTNIATVQGDGTPIDLHQPPPLNKPSNARGLNPLQLLGEGYAIATNQEEPVKAQLYNPELYQPYQVSFQDRLNQNQSTFNSVEKQLAYDPTSLATLAGQKYSADSGVLAEEFRVNQGIANDITNKNVSLLNEAKSKNLGILDQQYVRQSQAKSNTKRVNQEALNSISSKLLQKEASNNMLRVYENLYPDYAFNKRTGKAEYYGPDAASHIDWSGVQRIGNQPNKTKVATKAGNTTTTQYYEDPIDQAIKAKKL